MAQLLAELSKQYINSQFDESFKYKVNKIIMDLTIDQLVATQPISTQFIKFLFLEKIIQNNVKFNATGFINVVWMFYNIIVSIYDEIATIKHESIVSDSQHQNNSLFKVYQEIVTVDDYLVQESNRIIEQNHNTNNIKIIQSCFKQMYNLFVNQVNDVLKIKFNYFYWLQIQLLEEASEIDILALKYVTNEMQFTFIVNNMHKIKLESIDNVNITDLLNLLLAYINQNQNISYKIIFDLMQFISKVFQNLGAVDINDYVILFDILLQLNIIQYVNGQNIQSFDFYQIEEEQLSNIQQFEYKILWILYNYPSSDQQYFFIEQQQELQSESNLSLETLFFILLLSDYTDNDNSYILQYLDSKLQQQQILRFNQVLLLHEWLSLHSFVDLQPYQHIRYHVMNFYSSKKQQPKYNQYISQILLFGPINKHQYKQFVERLLGENKYVYQDILHLLYQYQEILSDQLDANQQILDFKQNITKYLKELFENIIYIDNKCQQQLFQIILVIQLVTDVQLDNDMLQIARLYADDQLIPVYCSKLLQTQENVINQLNEFKDFIPRLYTNSTTIEFFDAIQEQIKDFSIQNLLKQKIQFQLFINIAGKESGIYQVIQNKFNYLVKTDPFYTALGLQCPFFNSFQNQSFDNYVETIYCLLLCKFIVQQ